MENCPSCGVARQPEQSGTYCVNCGAPFQAKVEASNAGEPMAVRVPSACLILIHLKEYALLEATCRVGRDPTSDILVSDPLISRLHAEVCYQDGSYWITDQGSSNGTWVNNVNNVNNVKKLMPQTPHPLSDGDVLRMGGKKLLFYFYANREAIPFPLSALLADTEAEASQEQTEHAALSRATPSQEQQTLGPLSRQGPVQDRAFVVFPQPEVGEAPGPSSAQIQAVRPIEAESKVVPGTLSGEVRALEERTAQAEELIERVRKRLEQIMQELEAALGKELQKELEAALGKELREEEVNLWRLWRELCSKQRDIGLLTLVGQQAHRYKEVFELVKACLELVRPQEERKE